jgi:hypothetical protein
MNENIGSWMVFDCESVGLHGESFAVGYVVVDRTGKRLMEHIYACPPDAAKGDDEGRAWISENLPKFRADCPDPTLVRVRFWLDWMVWKERGALLIADCAWPVEARFLAACVDDFPNDPDRPWQGPYPLHELASFMVAAGMDPHATYDRLPDEPQHDPLGDARQSARLLIQALDTLDGAPGPGGTTR